MWHWARHEGPEQQDREAAQRLEQAKKLAAQSHNVTAALRREVEKNGWTELLQQAMGGR